MKAKSNQPTDELPEKQRNYLNLQLQKASNWTLRSVFGLSKVETYGDLVAMADDVDSMVAAVNAFASRWESLAVSAGARKLPARMETPQKMALMLELHGISVENLAETVKELERERALEEMKRRKDSAKKR